MDAKTLLDRLLVAADEAEKRALAETHRHLLDTAFFQMLKERVLELALEDSREALRVADIGLEVAEFATGEEGVAYAWWARGNALLFLGQHDDCLAAYSTAISLFAGLDRTEQVAQLQTNCMSPLMWTGRYAEAQAMGRGALDALAGQGDTQPLANLLLSLGACARRQGDHAGALAQAERAAGMFVRLDDVVRAARCWITQAVALEHLDRFEEAERLLQQALRVFAEQQKWLPWARAALNLGVLRARLADNQAALHWMEESRRAFLRAGVEMDAAVADLYRAQCFLDVNLLPEAAALGEELVETFSQLKMPRQVARALSVLADVYARLGQTDQARRALERAWRIFRTMGDKVEVALLDVRRAALLREQGRPGEASRLASGAADVLGVHRYPLRHAEAHLVLAACCEDLGMLKEAQMAYRVAWAAGSYPTGTTEPLPVFAYRIAHARGVIAEAAGDRALARGEYDRAVDYLGQIARGLGLDELRGGYLADKRPVYESALRLALEDDRVKDAFHIAESARAGALRDFIRNRQHATTVTGEGEPGRLAELKARWAWRVSTLHQSVDLAAEAEEEVVEPEDRSARLRELAALERELADAYRRRRLADPSARRRGELVEPFASASRNAAERTGRVPRSAVLEQGEVLGLDEIRECLPDGAALLAFDHVGDRLLAFVLTRDIADVVPLDSLAQLRWQGAGLSHALEEVRLFDGPADDSTELAEVLAMLEADLVEDLQALYQAVLVKPLARLGAEIHQLFIVPCDVLHTLPLEAFHDTQGHLLERYSLCYLPAASLLAALPARGPKSARGHPEPVEGHPEPVEGPVEGAKRQGDGVGPPLVIAHSWEGRLPLALEEATRVAQALAGGLGREPLLLTEERATAGALREHAGTAGLLHVAAHGTFRGDAPLFSSLHLADGPLTVNDVYGLDLSRAALVTLSGCQTGLGQGRGGEMLGLTHAFFFAGAPALVVSRWRVDDAATTDLMQDFYKALTRGETVAEALRTAQLGALARRPHAYYWAGFAVWGRGFDVIFHDG
jgi:CHAT domain-containing protein/tetratricopeptide (TPR) repeat protein